MNQLLNYLNGPIFQRGLLCTFGVGFILWLTTKMFFKNYSKILTKKKILVQENYNKIRKHLKELSGSNIDYQSLLNTNLTELCDQIASNQLDPIDLLHAYQSKVLSLVDMGNSGVAEFILDAESIFKSTNHELAKRSPLFGIPISVKESMSVKGCDATVGLIKYCNQPMLENMLIIQLLHENGAIPFVTTITNQLARSIDGFNPVYGNVNNPINKSRIPGGSSTGEGLLLALNGSPLGIGSDIAGSIRIPAAFCGLASLKPSYNRLSQIGMRSTAMRSTIGIPCSLGPMGKKTDDLVRFMRTLIGPKLFDSDPFVVPKLFDNNEFQSDKPLRIGYYTTFNHPNLLPTLFTNQNAVLKAVDILTRVGHNLVEFVVPEQDKIMYLALRCLFADGGRELRERLWGEPLGPHLKLLYYLLPMPNFILDLGSWIIKYLVGKPAALCHLFKGLKTGQMSIDLLNELKVYQQTFHQAWKSSNLDAVICPVMPYPAPSSSTSMFYVSSSVSYTVLYNLLDYPAGTVPMGFVTKLDVGKDLDQAKLLHSKGESFQSNLFKLAEGSEHLPLSVQVVAKPYHEETVLRVMKDIELNMSL